MRREQRRDAPDQLVREIYAHPLAAARGNRTRAQDGPARAIHSRPWKKGN